MDWQDGWSRILSRIDELGDWIDYQDGFSGILSRIDELGEWIGLILQDLGR